MLLSKEITVEIHLAGCKVKKYMATMLRKHGVPLWNFGEMTQQELADLMQKDKNSVTSLVDAIERKGFVVRRQSKTDRRSNTLVLTEKAELLKPGAKEKGISILDKMLEGISEEELRAFLATLRKLTLNMDVSAEA